MKKTKGNKLAFNDENYEKQFEIAIKRGKERIKKGEKIIVPSFLLASKKIKKT